MDDDSIQTLRKSTRESLKLNRRFQRDEVNDVQRCIKQLSISPQSFDEVVQKLKSKSIVMDADLQILKNGLMDNPKNIEIVLRTHGTLRGLVRELSGNDIRKQCAAAGCCCNLALGDSRACMAIAKASGPYLTAALDNLTAELAINCAWALGNLTGSGTKACDVLVAQGALSKLCELLERNNDDLQEAATYALTHFAYHMEDDLRTEHLQKLLKALSKIEASPSTCQLAFILSCHGDFVESVPGEFPQRLLAALDTCVARHQGGCGRDCNCELVYVVRTLANMDEEVYGAVLHRFSSGDLGKRLWQILNSDSGGLGQSLLWLFGNLYNSRTDDAFFATL
ncbi:unnamed protein product, partial [Iphiclides podalirius]